MIPAKIRLRNFLTFAAGTDGEPVELDFEGAALWSIAGTNGAGKSAIFDAINYALYGEHRGGKQHDNRLVRKGATTAKVDFEFEQAGTRYRVERSITIKVGRNGQTRPDAKHVQASFWDDTDHAWVPIPDTDKPTELDRWVRELLGMGSDTFRSSVLLRQGEADKLLNVRASDRFDTLAGLIDLRAYKTLEALAVDRRRADDTTVDHLEEQLQQTEDIGPEAVALAEALYQESENTVRGGDELRRRADRSLQGAQRHAGLQQQHSELTAKQKQLEGIINIGEDIRQRAEERRRLEGTLRPVKTALEYLRSAAADDEEARGSNSQVEAIDLDQLALRAADRMSSRDRLEEELDGTQEESDQLGVLLRHADAIWRCRTEVTQRQDEVERVGDPKKLTQSVKGLEQQLTTARQGEAAIREEQQEALDQRGRAQSRLDQAKESDTALQELTAGAKCSRCGQPITKEHLLLERSEAASKLEEAKTGLQEVEGKLSGILKRLEEFAQSIGLLDSQHRRSVTTADRAVTAARELRESKESLSTETERAAEVDLASAHATLFTGLTEAPLREAEASYEQLRVLALTVKSGIGKLRSRYQKARREAEEATEQLAAAKLKRTNLLNRLTNLAEKAAQYRLQADAWLNDVPEAISSAVRAGDETVLVALSERLAELADADEKLVQLRAAENDLAGVVANVRSVESTVAAMPEQHRLCVDDAQAALDTAEKELEDARESRDAARDEHRRLAEVLRSRFDIVGQMKTARGNLVASRRLATLLGKTELQGRLVADATAGVEAYANDTLARISAQTLQLYLRNDENNRLDIFVKDLSSATEPLEVAFISGSQKFRVAVALAAGLGQYIGGRTAIRSLIIDEGFGSLDADGRQRMIEELHALAESLDRVIVVSHQEDFADRTLFPNSYILRKEGTRTTVEHVT